MYDEASLSEEKMTEAADSVEDVAAKVQTGMSKEERLALKREKFLTIGARRTNTALESIRLVKQLSNTSTYSYTDEEVERMFASLQEALDDARASFKSEKTSGKKLFSFD